MPLAANPVYAVDLFRHAASYFGNAEAQYRLARLYMNGTGVEKNVGLAVNWLAIAAKKQHAASQATLGEILWRGQEVRQRRARGLALIMLAHENAVAGGKEPQWIGELYREALGASDNATRKDAEAMLPELGGVKSAAVVPAAKAKPAEIVVMPAAGRDRGGCPGGLHGDLRCGALGQGRAAAGLDGTFGGLRRHLDRGGRPQALNRQLDEDRHVVRGLLPASRRGIDLASLEPVGRLRRQQQMVDAQALVLLEGAGLIVPERVAVRLVVAGAERAGQPEIERAPGNGRASPAGTTRRPSRRRGCRRPPAPGSR